MKTTVKALVFLLLFTATAYAEDNDNLWAFSFTPIVIPAHTVLHESFHALSVKLMGRDVASFKPYPHMHDGGFYLGRVDGWTGNPPPSQNQELAFYVAPYVMDVVIFAATDSMLSSGAVNIKTFWGTTLYLFGMAAPLVDFAKGYAYSGDWNSIRQLSKGRALTANVLGFVALAVGLYRFAVHTRELLR